MLASEMWGTPFEVSMNCNNADITTYKKLERAQGALVCESTRTHLRERETMDKYKRKSIRKELENGREAKRETV